MLATINVCYLWIMIIFLVLVFFLLTLLNFSGTGSSFGFNSEAILYFQLCGIHHLQFKST